MHRRLRHRKEQVKNVENNVEKNVELQSVRRMEKNAENAER